MCNINEHVDRCLVARSSEAPEKLKASPGHGVNTKRQSLLSFCSSPPGPSSSKGHGVKKR